MESNQSNSRNGSKESSTQKRDVSATIGAVMVLMLVAVIVAVFSPGKPEMSIREMVLMDVKKMNGRFFVEGETNVFVGLIIEHDSEGGLKLRSAAKDGICVSQSVPLNLASHHEQEGP